MADAKEFRQLWERVVLPVYTTSLDECDAQFAKDVGLHYRGENTVWREQVENKFHHHRHNFKDQCYGKKEMRSKNPLLDSRKVAAVLCQTFLSCKPFGFDLVIADKIAAEQKSRLTSLEYTKWAVNNTLINYKFAYLASVQLVYLTLASDLLEHSKKAAENLIDVGRLFRYQTDTECDTMDTNVIVGLARGDMSGQELNMLLFAMLLYQYEMYTRECLKTADKQTSQNH